MSALRESAPYCAGLFRLGRDVEAAVLMVELFDGAPGVFVNASQDLQRRFAMLFGELLAAQQRQDWIALADGLEYDLVDLIDQASSL